MDVESIPDKPGSRKAVYNVFSDEAGTELINYGGDAPVPTVRVSPHKRPPISKSGFRYIKPTIEELIPYDTSMLMQLQSAEPGVGKEWVNPQAFVGDINSSINTKPGY